MKKLITLLFISLSFAACTKSDELPTPSTVQYEGLHLYDGATEFTTPIVNPSTNEQVTATATFDPTANTIDMDTSDGASIDTMLITKTICNINYKGKGITFYVYYTSDQSATPFMLAYNLKTHTFHFTDGYKTIDDFEPFILNNNKGATRTK